MDTTENKCIFNKVRFYFTVIYGRKIVVIIT